MATSDGSGLVDVAGGKLFHRQAGQGAPIVFIHASIADHRMWNREAEVYSKSWQVVRYDTRGLGRSSPASAPYSDVEDLHTLLQHLHLGPATIVGCSNGGRIAIDYALEHPAGVRALVLVAPGISGFTAELEPEGKADYARDNERSAPIFAAWRAGSKEEAMDLLITYWASQVRGASRELVRQMVQENAQEIFTDQSASHATAPEPPAAVRLSSIRRPTVVMYGDKDELTIGYMVRRIAREVPGARFVSVPGADHLINLSRPEPFDAALRSML